MMKYAFTEVSRLDVRQLLRFHAAVENELKNRNIIRSSNKPTGDLAELIFCKAFGWRQESNSNHGYDAVDDSGTRFQIKGRKLTRQGARQLSAIRNIETKPFDVLAAVLMDDYYEVVRAALIPHELVLKQSRYSSHVKGHLFYLRDSVWDDPSVSDVTRKLDSVVLS